MKRTFMTIRYTNFQLTTKGVVLESEFDADIQCLQVLWESGDRGYYPLRNILAIEHSKHIKEGEEE